MFLRGEAKFRKNGADYDSVVIHFSQNAHILERHDEVDSSFQSLENDHTFVLEDHRASFAA
jgi:hypothetical protein